MPSVETAVTAESDNGYDVAARALATALERAAAAGQWELVGKLQDTLDRQLTGGKRRRSRASGMPQERPLEAGYTRHGWTKDGKRAGVYRCTRCQCRREEIAPGHFRFDMADGSVIERLPFGGPDKTKTPRCIPTVTEASPRSR